AARCVDSMEGWTIPRCDAALDVTVGRAEHKVTFPHHIVEWRIAVRAAGLRTGNGVRHRVDVGGWRRCWTGGNRWGCSDRPPESGASGQHTYQCERSNRPAQTA